MEQLPHGDAARHALVSRLLTKYLYQVTPPYRFVLKIFSLERFRCSNWKSTTGDVEVFFQRWFGERKSDMVSICMKDGCGRVKERERRIVRKVNSG